MAKAKRRRCHFQQPRRLEPSPSPQQLQRLSSRFRSINELPDNILQDIVSRMPLEDKAKTAFLSKRWLKFWTSNSIWDLSFAKFPRMRDKEENFESMVDRIVHLHDGPGIRDFRLDYPEQNRNTSRARAWIEKLLRTGISKLDITMDTPMPLCMFTCNTLTRLTLHLDHVLIKLPPAPSMANLRSLTLIEVVLDGDNLEKLLAACPGLEELMVQNCLCYGGRFNDVVRIEHSHLQKVMIIGCEELERSKLRISGPSLTTFVFKGDGLSYKGNEFNMPLVKTAELDLVLPCDLWKDHSQRATRAQPMFNVLTSLQTVSYLSLGAWCIEYLSLVPGFLEHSCPPCNATKSLRIAMWPNEGHTYVATRLIRACPNLEDIIIAIELGDTEVPGAFESTRSSIDKYPEVPDCYTTEMVHPKLKRAELNGFGARSYECLLVRHLLETGVALQKLVCKPEKMSRKPEEVLEMHFCLELLKYASKAAAVEIKLDFS